MADVLSRWAYPASQAYKDMCKHGTLEDKELVEEFEREEREEAKNCMWVRGEFSKQEKDIELGEARSCLVVRRKRQEPESAPTQFFFKHLGPPARQGVGTAADSSLRGLGIGPTDPPPDGRDERHKRRTAVREKEEQEAMKEEDPVEEIQDVPDDEDQLVKSEVEGNSGSSSDIEP